MSKRNFNRQSSVRAARLKPAGQSRWVDISLTDWSVAGAGLRGPLDGISAGPAIVVIADRHGDPEFRLSCEIVWQEKGRMGLRFSGPIHD